MIKPKEIESLKSTLTQLIKQGCRVKCEANKIDGRVVGIGYKPFWTNPYDSKIEKLELHFRDDYGKIIPFVLHNVIGYDVVSFDGKRFEDSKSVSLDFHVYSANKAREAEPYDKIRFDIISEQKG